jgi:ATP-dependent DNA helicase RecG
VSERALKTQELLKIIKNGEGQEIEFKSRCVDDTGASICSFANTNDGLIIIGISNDKRLSPAKRAKEVPDGDEAKIANLAHSSKPAIYPAVKEERHFGKRLFFVNVPYSGGPLHSFRNIAYKRVGSHDKPLSVDEVINHAKSQRIVRFDDQQCDATLSDIDKSELATFLRSAQESRDLDINPELSVDNALDKLNLRRGGRLTNGAILIFGKNPQKYFPQARVRCARFKGRSLDYIDMKVLDAGLIEQINDAEEFVKKHINFQAEFADSFTREEKWEYPIPAIREAITNAICHRDYFSPAHVQISIYDDEIRIDNPGGLPPELTIADLKREHSSIPRNPLIAETLFLSKHVERWGGGTQRMVEAMLTNDFPEPEFLEGKNGFGVIFRKAEAYIGTLNARQKEGWKYLRTNDKITRSAYTELCRCSPRTALSDLQGMAEKGIVKLEGRKKAAYYRRLA